MMIIIQTWRLERKGYPSSRLLCSERDLCFVLDFAVLYHSKVGVCSGAWDAGCSLVKLPVAKEFFLGR